MVNKLNIIGSLLALALCQPDAPPQDSALIQAVDESGELDLDNGAEEQDSHFDNHSGEQDGKDSKRFAPTCEYVKIKNMGSHQFLAQQVLKQEEGKFLAMQQCENVGMLGMESELYKKHAKKNLAQ